MVEGDLVDAPDAARNVRRLMAVAKGADGGRVCGIYVRVKGMRTSEGVGGGCECRRKVGCTRR